MNWCQMQSNSEARKECQSLILGASWQQTHSFLGLSCFSAQLLWTARAVIKVFKLHLPLVLPEEDETLPMIHTTKAWLPSLTDAMFAVAVQEGSLWVTRTS